MVVNDASCLNESVGCYGPTKAETRFYKILRKFVRLIRFSRYLFLLWKLINDWLVIEIPPNETKLLQKLPAKRHLPPRGQLPFFEPTNKLFFDIFLSINWKPAVCWIQFWIYQEFLCRRFAIDFLKSSSWSYFFGNGLIVVYKFFNWNIRNCKCAASYKN